MENTEPSQRLSAFLDTGIYRFEGSNSVFIDPVRVLNRSYTRFEVSPSAYYSRFFDSQPSSSNPDRESNLSTPIRKKRKRKDRKLNPHALNEREQAADRRHRQVRPMLLEAHDCLMAAGELLAVMRKLRGDCSGELRLRNGEQGQSIVEIGKLWQAPLYEITLNFEPIADEGSFNCQCSEQRVIPVFGNLVCNETGDDVEGEFLNRKYIIPKDSCFYMSDFGQIYNLVPANPGSGFNLIMVDPPWENASAHQKLLYPTLPNRYLLSIPIKKLAHSDGALVALWVTNREKLRNFIEKELFPTWGVKYAASLHWLKVKADGSLISDLDIFHHRPYECLLLGYCFTKETDSEQPLMFNFRPIKDDQVMISIPGGYSRKPPVGEFLLEHAPGMKAARCIELFAREMMTGWTSWGNEPLHFQESRYFLRG